MNTEAVDRLAVGLRKSRIVPDADRLADITLLNDPALAAAIELGLTLLGDGGPEFLAPLIYEHESSFPEEWAAGIIDGLAKKLADRG